MVKGISRQVIVVHSPDPKLFEQAIFIVRNDAAGKGVTSRELVEEARRVARDYPDCYDKMVTLEQLDEVLPEADIIVCALPHTPETVGLLNRHRLGLMKPDAVLVNGGRGSLIDQDALCELLQAGHFWGVGLEVTSPEPLPKGHPLWDQPRLMITPHAAGNSFGPGSPLERKIWDHMIRNVTAYLRGEPIKNQIDFTTGYRKL